MQIRPKIFNENPSNLIIIPRLCRAMGVHRILTNAPVTNIVNDLCLNAHPHSYFITYVLPKHFSISIFFDFDSFQTDMINMPSIF